MKTSTQIQSITRRPTPRPAHPIQTDCHAKGTPTHAPEIPPFEELENRVKASSLEITNMRRRSLQLAIEVGRDLTELKSHFKREFPKERWGEYVKNDLQLSPTTATNYMRLFENQDYLKNSANFAAMGIFEALQLLTKKSKKEKLLLVQNHPELALDYGESSQSPSASGESPAEDTPENESSSGDGVAPPEGDPLPVNDATDDESMCNDIHLTPETFNHPDNSEVANSAVQQKPIPTSDCRIYTPLISTDRAEAAVQDLLCDDELDPLRREIFLEVVASVNRHPGSIANPDSAMKLIPVLEKLTEILRQITSQA